MNRCQTTELEVVCPSNIGGMCIHRKCQYNVRPKYFTDFLKGIWALPMVIEVGMVWRCFVLLEVTIVLLFVIMFRHFLCCPSIDIT